MGRLLRARLVLANFSVPWMVASFRFPTTRSTSAFGCVRNDSLCSLWSRDVDTLFKDWSATLTAGGTLCVVPKRELMDNLGSVIDSLDVTFLETTPTGKC